MTQPMRDRGGALLALCMGCWGLAGAVSCEAQSASCAGCVSVSAAGQPGRATACYWHSQAPAASRCKAQCAGSWGASPCGNYTAGKDCLAPAWEDCPPPAACPPPTPAPPGVHRRRAQYGLTGQYGRRRRGTSGVGCTECDTPYSPYATWKAYLNPTAAGGDYTITANCTGCGGDPKYWGASITNVTFGDVWHCSGQSNMWLPLGNTFHRNDTMDAILKEGKYANMRGMIGNSGNGNSIASNPWMTALGAAQAVTNSDNTVSGLMDFGAACWYFGQTITDLGVEAGNLTAEGAPVPLGLVNTAIGGQRIEEYQVNDTVSSPVQCGGASSAWNGRLFARMVMPFVDMTTKGFLWYQVRAGCAAASPRARHALTVASLRSSHQPLSCTYRAKTTRAEQRATALTTSATRAIKRRSSKGGARSSARRQGRRIRSLHSAS